MGALQGQSASIAQAAASGAALTGVLVGVLASIPVAGPIAAGIAELGLAIANAFSGCGQTCIQASNIANQVEPILQQNLETYTSAPVRYASMQAAALNNFDTAWSALVQACGQPGLQQAGENCISDRQRGACKWKARAGAWIAQGGSFVWQPWGPAGSGSDCFNWFAGYRDPIANDPGVVADPASSISAIPAELASGSLFGIPLSALAIPAALVLAALLWPSD